jgi:hypothetical protein
MVPEPSTSSPPIPFIGVETVWEEVPYMAGQGSTEDEAVRGRFARQRPQAVRRWARVTVVGGLLGGCWRRCWTENGVGEGGVLQRCKQSGG